MAAILRAIRETRGILTRRSNQKSLVTDWTTHKYEERKLERSK
ncbi:MAG: hypothetical protein ABI443_09135 [Chthoniobacterales bacterium]